MKLSTYLWILCHDAAMYNIQHMQLRSLLHTPSHSLPASILPRFDLPLHVTEQSRSGGLRTQSSAQWLLYNNNHLQVCQPMLGTY